MAVQENFKNSVSGDRIKLEDGDEKADFLHMVGLKGLDESPRQEVGFLRILKIVRLG
jgi:hypothetical protein